MYSSVLDLSPISPRWQYNQPKNVYDSYIYINNRMVCISSKCHSEIPEHLKKKLHHDRFFGNMLFNLGKFRNNLLSVRIFSNIFLNIQTKLCTVYTVAKISALLRSINLEPQTQSRMQRKITEVGIRSYLRNRTDVINFVLKFTEHLS